MTVDHPATLPVKGTLVSLLDRIADRIHAQGDAAARAQGLTVTRLPGADPHHYVYLRSPQW